METPSTIQRPHLSAAIQAAARFCATDGYLPILNSVLVQCDGQRLFATGTDLNVFGTCAVPCQSEPFAVVVDPGGIIDLLAHTQTDDLALRVTATGYLEITHQTARCISRFSFPVISASDFPVMPGHTGDSLTLDAARLAGALKAVLPFAPKPSSRRWHQTPPAIFFQASGDSLTVVACDGSRFNQATLPLEHTDLPEGRTVALVPAALDNLLRLLKGTPEGATVQLHLSEKHASFSLDAAKNVASITVGSRLLDAQIDIEKNVSLFESPAGSITVERRSIERALQRLARIAKSDSNRVELQVRDNTILMSAHSIDTGTASEPLDALVEGCDIAFALSLTHLQSALKATPTPQVVIEYQDDAMRVVRVGGVLIKPVATLAVEEAERAAKRAAQEAVAAGADIQGLTDGIVQQWLETHRETFWGNVGALKFKTLAEAGSKADLPDELRALDTDIVRGVRERIGATLAQRGILEDANDDAAYQVNQAWADSLLTDGEVERRARAHEVLAELAAAYVGKLRNPDKIDYAEQLLAYYQGFTQGQYPSAGRSLSGTEQRDVRTRIGALMSQVRSAVEATVDVQSVGDAV